MSRQSLVMQYLPPDAQENAARLRHKLSYYTDAWDLAQDLAAGIEALVVIDTRSAAQYHNGHICGAISFPHREMTDERLRCLDADKVYVTYCDGIGCNGSTRGALRLAAAGFRVKELIGGLDFWCRDNHPLIQGSEPGSWPDISLPDCGC
ncbi:rhodanese [Erwinia sp. OLTSP20]|uniref:rhodanese-like domain-containing protein n=1 Tax=unclassified Erwinia TaxID=2622719 RepID=UPI000C19CD6B|nr:MULTISPECIES: rhodanese-like domain-containing protein [unclassified Erwinia]PIJ51516.1 rhodanese [Erwinia sp. OAMSP11]PIJ75897.1 rhodanese [Erwinia sp. OLSSP12]PIJ83427.1 rhodanese [Erwinia sp. OLCASP19]PIJ86260.1 rhodanese [Erwinia sp. OLMTSP26]PIJ88497.1 rhodanese [Erwinia sp. OLMDSP33]